MLVLFSAFFFIYNLSATWQSFDIRGPSISDPASEDLAVVTFERLLESLLIFRLLNFTLSIHIAHTVVQSHSRFNGLHSSFAARSQRVKNLSLKQDSLVTRERNSLNSLYVARKCFWLAVDGA